MRRIMMRNFFLFTLVLIIGLLPLIVSPESAQNSHYQQGNYHLANRQYKKAISEYKKAIKIDPNDADTYHNLGLAYERLRKYRKAIESYEKALEVSPGDAITFYNIGVAYGNLGKKREAIKYYEKSLQLNPNHIGTYNNLGVIYGEFGEYEEAIACYEKILEIDPNDTDAYNNIGWVKSDLKQYEEAVKYFQKALEIDPSYVKAYNNLGEVYSKLGQRQKSKESYQVAKELTAMHASSNHMLVTDFSERIPGGLGLSILSPQKKGWFIVKNSPMGGLNFKKIDNLAHTFGCHIVIIPVDKEFENPDKFLEWVKQSHQKDTDPKRFKNEKYSYDLNERFSPYCVRYQVKSTDIKRKTAEGNYLILKIYGYIFIHPKSSKYAVQIWYSERGIAKDFTSSFQKVANEFIDNLIVGE